MNLQTGTTLLSPQTISERIERCVRLRTGGMIRGLRVDVTDEEVVISGRTTTYYNKQLATHAALDAAKEISLKNDIEVC
jgi:hypothetical protein